MKINKKILIVEDETIVAMDLQKRLENMGYTVTAIAYSGEEAIKETEAAMPDLVLMDIKLKGEINGIGSAAKIRERFDIPVVYLTAYADEDTIQRAKITEPYGYIIKPFEERELHTGIEIALYKHTMERKVKDNEEWFNITLKSIGDAVIAADTNGKVIFMNPKASLITAWKIEDAQGKDLKDVFRVLKEEEHTFLNSHIGKVLKEAVVVNLPNSILITRDGKEVNVDINAAPIKEDRGNIIGLVVAFRDVSERWRIERLKDELISNVSHEMRTPLTSIRESVSQVLDGILGEITPEQRKFLNIGLSNIDRLNRIIDGLLDIAKIEACQMRLQREVVNIAALVKDAAESFVLQFQSKGLELRIVLPDKKIEICVDKDKVIQVINNLLNNAFKFMEKGYVEISVEDRDDKILCSVMDTGAGVSEEDLVGMFDKFQQFKRVEGPGEKGVGLGLYISKCIIELHGGKIWAESKLNQGTKVTFTFFKYSIKESLREDITLKIFEVRRSNKDFAVIFIRIDDYGQIENDLGEEKAKDIFVKMRSVINSSIRKEDFETVGGKDRIVIILDGDKENLFRVSNRLKRAVKRFTFGYRQEAEIDVSYGYAVYPKDGSSFDDLLEKAEGSFVSEKQEQLVRSIMIVDDEADTVRILKKELQAAGYTNIIEAYSGEEVFEKIKDKIPDLIIIDIVMPIMSGYEVIGRLKENRDTEDIPILIMSGDELEEDKIEEYLREKAMLAINKPFNTEKIKRFLEYLL